MAHYRQELKLGKNMNTKALTERKPHVSIINGEIKTTSLKVAEYFGKRHDNVLQAIENIECSDAFRLLNFKEASYEVDQPNGGKASYTMMEITKDGFVFLVMGFTGKEAAKWKEAYITEFNRMAEELQNRKADLARLKTSVTQSADRLLDMIASLPYNYDRFSALRKELDDLKLYILRFEVFDAHAVTLQEFQFKMRNRALAEQLNAKKLN